MFNPFLKIKQYLVPFKYRKNLNIYLSKLEKHYFLKQSNYDKNHSYLVFSKIIKLRKKNNKRLLNVALLHDVGKTSTFLEKIVYKIFKIGSDKNHPKLGYIKLKSSSKYTRYMVLNHHKKLRKERKELTFFQKIDNES